ncbi:predicted protein [Lodderomyces elongisporus NRRL YB-4239]|uniref:Uncharacterized protein n=1 Tax=Lodderomyces elongisporus (strain ATCC 11503 / CBS 2605 / JCM 1781 / NBRC 1676 / NRRL YB-4239) TaxID=379508 RepID=A5DXS2_LODEL|nr:predicted protein [Lodderomyces elongisporus NRRL YB-4239]
MAPLSYDLVRGTKNVEDAYALGVSARHSGIILSQVGLCKSPCKLFQMVQKKSLWNLLPGFVNVASKSLFARVGIAPLLLPPLIFIIFIIFIISNIFIIVCAIRRRPNSNYAIQTCQKCFWCYSWCFFLVVSLVALLMVLLVVLLMLCLVVLLMLCLVVLLVLCLVVLLMLCLVVLLMVLLMLCLVVLLMVLLMLCLVVLLFLLLIFALFFSNINTLFCLCKHSAICN